ncbi:MAG: hypothetical protein Kow0042_27960 [Calditrichia bacterium]
MKPLTAFFYNLRKITYGGLGMLCLITNLQTQPRPQFSGKMSENVYRSQPDSPQWVKAGGGFEENRGQVGDPAGRVVPQILFQTRMPGMGIYLTESGVSYVHYQESGNLTEPWYGNATQFPTDNALKTSSLRYARIDLEMVEARISRDALEFADPLPGYANYYFPWCPEGILGVIAYRKVTIKDIYPGIDWVWLIDETAVHHEFHIAAGADASRIKFRVRRAEVEITENGKFLIYSTPLGSVTDGEISCREIGGLKNSQPIGRYKMDKSGLIFPEIKDYSGKRPLIIDPPLSLLWATYYGGEISDYGRSIKVDSSGNVFVTGETASALFPTQNPGGGAFFQGSLSGFTDLFMIKFNSSGQREWATYYGGSDWDHSYAMALDPSGNVFLAGATWSPNFPLYDPGGGAYFQGNIAGQDDIYLVKFDHSGVRQWATFYGGSFGDGSESITADDSGNIFLTGYTQSQNFPTFDPGGGAYFDPTYNGGIFDVFILKFNNSGARQWATYYGGNSEDVGVGITTDREGNVFLTGGTESISFPTYDPGGGAFYQGSKAGYGDIFILKFTNSGVRRWATFYGGNDYDHGNAITTDHLGNIFLTGDVESTDFPTFDPGGGAYYDETYNGGTFDAIILKFDNFGVRKWATLYGGNHWDRGTSIQTDGSGNLYVSGWTYSPNFPTYDPGGGAYYQGNKAGEDDIFILKFSNAGLRQWATYYGGGQEDWCYSASVDGGGNLYLTGASKSLDLPTLDPGGGAYYQGNNMGYFDMVLLKFEGSPPLSLGGYLVLPQRFTLYQNYPNPFNSATTIDFALPEKSYIRLVVYDIAGRLVKTLAEGVYDAGHHRIQLTAGDWASGIYIYHFVSDKFTARKKMLLIK